VRENAGEDSELVAARPPEAKYGKYVQCGFCSTTHDTSTLYLHPEETHIQCGICGKLIELGRKEKVPA
jgi:transcription elongation factor Elf1